MAEFPVKPQRKSDVSKGIPPERFYGTSSRDKAGGSAPSHSIPSHMAYADPTPHKPSSHGTESVPQATVSDLQRLKQELGPFAKVDDLKTRLVDLLKSHGGYNSDPSSHIDQFLKQSDRYYTVPDGSKRWKVPRSTLRERQLYQPFERIFSSVQSHATFVTNGYIHGNYHDTHSTTINHHLDCPGVKVLKTKPDSVVSNSRRCCKDCDLQELRYCHVRTAFDIKTTSNVNLKVDRLQIAVYARQILAEQPGRAWVPSLLVTEKHFVFFGFDRSGGWESQKYNIHVNADIFVLAILVLFANDDAIGHVFPLVPSQSHPPETIRRHNNLTLLVGSGAQSKEIPGAFCHTTVKPVLSRHTIRGRGTCCFTVVGGVVLKKQLSEVPITVPRRLLLKSYWRTKERPAEFKFLKDARGLPGVCQLVGFSPDDAGEMVTAFRGDKLEAFRSTTNRIHCQLLLEHYDGPLCTAPNPLAFMRALRDAVEGHRFLLVKHHILHRDISINNIVYDARGGPGSQGRIIDLDLAESVVKLWSSDHKSTKGDARTGTIAYMSYKLLIGKPAELGPHDHMDDLESFCYVLCHFLAALKGPSGHSPPLPHRLQGWESDNWNTCAYNKRSFFLTIGSFLREDLGPWFTPYLKPLANLLTAFASLFEARMQAITQATGIFPTPYPDLNLPTQERLTKANDDYAAFIHAIDEAIKAFGGDRHTDDSMHEKEVDEVEYDDASEVGDEEQASEVGPLQSPEVDASTELALLDLDEAPSEEGNWDDDDDDDNKIPQIQGKSTGSLHPDAALSTSHSLKRPSGEGDLDNEHSGERPNKRSRPKSGEA